MLVKSEDRCSIDSMNLCLVKLSIVFQHEEKRKSVTVIYHWKIIKKSNSCIVAIHEGEEVTIKEMFLILGNK